MFLAQGNFVVLHVVVIGSQEFDGFLGNDGTLEVLTGETLDSLGRGPQRFDDELDNHAVGLREHAGFQEAFLGTKNWQNVVVEMAQISG